MIATDLSKQQELDTNPKEIQQINFTRILDQPGNSTMFFIIKEAKETVLHFLRRTVKVLWMSLYDVATACFTIYFCFDIILI